MEQSLSFIFYLKQILNLKQQLFFPLKPWLKWLFPQPLLNFRSLLLHQCIFLRFSSELFLMVLAVPINPFLAAFNALLVGIFIFFPFPMVLLDIALATGTILLLSFRFVPRVLAME